MTATEPLEPASGSRPGPDLDLVRLAQAGDTEAFGELVERNRRAVFRAALAAVGSPAEADDVAQEAFVTAYRKLGSVPRRSSVPHLAAVDHLAQGDRPPQERRRWLRLTVSPGRLRTSDAFELDRTACPHDRRSQEDDLAAAELQRTCKRLIADAAAKLRDALLLAGSGEHTYDEIGQMLGMPVGTVKWRVSEARRVLKQKLAAPGIRL